MTQRRIETGHHGWSCPQPLRPIGLPYNPMECGLLTLQDRQGAQRLFVISQTHCRFPAPSNDYRVYTADGPYAETKEQLGGILVLAATDLNHAVQLRSKYPGVKAGAFEMRPAEA